MFSSGPFIAVDSSQINGNIDNKDTIINDACIKNPLEKLLKFFIFSTIADTVCFQTV